jgi:hypothetical protein
MQFSTDTYYFMLPGFIYILLSTLCSDILSLTRETKYYILTKLLTKLHAYNLFDRRREHERFSTERKQTFAEVNLLLISV